MDHILFAGSLPSASTLHRLHDAGYTITLLPPSPAASMQDSVPAGDLLILGLDTVEAADSIAAGPRLALPWLAWNLSDRPAVALAAYEAGATAVLPAATTPELLLQTVRHALKSPGARPATSRGPAAYRRRFRSGEQIRLAADEVTEVERGVVAQVAVHQDGKEVLLGLCGPETLIVGHGDDACGVHLRAHDDATVLIRPWSEAARDPRFGERLALRLRRMEAWASMQGRPYLDQRVLGVLELLAEEFGLAHPHGILIDIRVTHAMLASAVGATRTTVTRILGELRTRGVLTSTPSFGGDRLCLRHRQPANHRVGIGAPSTRLVES